MKKKWVYLVMLMAVFSGWSAGSLQGASLFEQAETAYQGGRYNEALDLYRLVTGHGARSPQFLYNMGNVYFQLGQFGEAKAYYLRAASRAPRDADVRSNLELVNTRLGLMGRDYDSQSLASLSYLRVFSFEEHLLIFSLLLFITNGLIVVYRRWPYFAGKQVIVGMGCLTAVYLSFIALSGFERYGAQHAVIVQPHATVQSGPSDALSTLASLKEGQFLVIEKRQDGWVKCRSSDGISGWIAKSALTEL